MVSLFCSFPLSIFSYSGGYCPLFSYYMTLATFQDIQDTANYLVSRVDVNSSLGAVVNLLYNCGLRIDEACQLRRFTLFPSLFIVDTEKKSLDRTFLLPLLPSAYLPLLSNPVTPLSLWVISSPTSVSRFILKNSPKVFFKGENKITTNIFRYYYARNLQNQGYTLAQIQAAMGHSSPLSTMSYLAPVFFD